MKKIIFSLIFLIPLTIHAESSKSLLNQNDSSCWSSYSNDSGTGWAVDQSTECTNYQNFTKILINQNREIIYFYDNSSVYYTDIISPDGSNSYCSIEFFYPTGSIENTACSELEDGEYFLSITTMTETHLIPLYIKDNKFYFDLNDIPETAGGTEKNNIEFGLAIIIAIMSITFIGYLWNSFKSKKYWK